MEKIINVPLEKREIRQLKAIAGENGRAMGREAARMIREGIEKKEEAK